MRHQSVSWVVAFLFAQMFWISPVSAQTSIEPMRDGENMFPAIMKIVMTADRFVHLAIWAFDNEMRWAAGGQPPVLHSRLGTPNPANPADTVEDLRCNQGALAGLPAGPLGPGGPLDPTSVITILRCKAAELAVIAENMPGLTPVQIDRARADIKVMVWTNRLDLNDFAPAQTNLGDLAFILLPRQTIIGWNRQQLHDEMRRRGSGESMEVLLQFQRYYQSVRFIGLRDLPMPTGIHILTQKNETQLTASHHQKLLVTDSAAYVGGLNYLKEYWDTVQHVPNDARRMSSGTLAGAPGIADYQGPLHDTGAIVRGALLAPIHTVFLERWSTSITNFHNEGLQRSGRTAYGDIKRYLRRHYPPTNPFGARRRLLTYIDRLETQPFVVNPSLLVMPVAPDPRPALKAIAPKLAVSRPLRSYRSTAPVQEIRDEYRATINRLMPFPGAFSYYENQYAQDHDFFLDVFGACTPRVTHLRTWCRRDPYAFFVIPYVPEGVGIEAIDSRLVRPGIVKQEMQNFVWAEIKSARAVIDRVSGNLIGTLEDPPACPACNPQLPFIRFDDPAAEADPSNVQLDSTVTMLVTTGRGPQQVCDPAVNPPTFIQCPIQAQVTKRVRDIIADSAIMSYVLVTGANPGATAGPTPPPADPLSVYHGFLKGASIYIHSKHSAFFGFDSGAQTIRYVVGSANLNPRSLGFVRAQGAADGEDSETAMFWTAADDHFWREVWKEHLGSLDPAAIPITAAEEWANQGWSNWRLIRGGGVPAGTERVVRLDAVERCIRLAGCT